MGLVQRGFNWTTPNWTTPIWTNPIWTNSPNRVSPNGGCPIYPSVQMGVDRQYSLLCLTTSSRLIFTPTFWEDRFKGRLSKTFFMESVRKWGPPPFPLRKQKSLWICGRQSKPFSFVITPKTLFLSSWCAPPIYFKHIFLCTISTSVSMCLLSKYTPPTRDVCPTPPCGKKGCPAPQKEGRYPKKIVLLDTFPLRE